MIECSPGFRECGLPGKTGFYYTLILNKSVFFNRISISKIQPNYFNMCLIIYTMLLFLKSTIRNLIVLDLLIQIVKILRNS